MPYMNSNFLGLTKRKAKHVKGHEVVELAAATAILSYYVLDKHQTYRAYIQQSVFTCNLLTFLPSCVGKAQGSLQKQPPSTKQQFDSTTDQRFHLTRATEPLAHCQIAWATDSLFECSTAKRAGLYPLPFSTIMMRRLGSTLSLSRIASKMAVVSASLNAQIG
jgi:hypothetical protein